MKDILRLDFSDYVVTGIALNDSVNDLVDSIYKQKPEKYYEAFRENERLYTSTRYELFPAITYSRMEKVAGILAYAEKTNDFVNVYRLIKKTYPKMYQLATQKSKISNEEWSNAMFQSGGRHKTSESYYYSSLFCFAYLIKQELKKGRVYRIEATDAIERLLLQHTQFTMAAYEVYKNVKNEGNISHLPNTQITAWDNLKNTFNLQTPLRIQTWLDFVIHKDMLNTFFSGNEIVTTFDQIRYDNKRDEIFNRGGDSSLIGLYSSLLRCFGFFEPMFEQTLQKEEVRALLHVMEVIAPSNNIKPSKELLITLIFMTAILKEYTSIRPFVPKASSQFMEYERSLWESDLVSQKEEEITQLKAIIAQQQHDLVQAKEREQAFNQEKRAWESERKELLAAIQEHQSEHDELISLREYVFTQQSEVNEEDEIQEKEIDLSEVEIAVIGGHDAWCNQLKQKIPHATFISPERAQNNSIKHIATKDVVIFNTLYNSHGAYYRTLQAIPDKRKLLFVDGRGTNISRLLERVQTLYQER